MIDDEAACRPQAPLLSVVFSFRDEEPVLAELVGRMRRVLQDEKDRRGIRGWELVFVDDDSRDGSFELLRRLERDHEDIRIVRMSRCFGISPCALAGMARSQGDLIVYMDCDLQDPPEVICDMLAAWRKGGVDVVHTVRLARDGDSAFRILVTQLGYRILKSLACIDLPVEAGDFKLLTRKAVEQLLRHKEQRPYLRALVCSLGFGQAFVSYRRAKRHSGYSKSPILSWRVVGNFFESALISFSLLPLYAAGFLGLAATAAGALAAAYLLIERSRAQALPPWLPVVAAVVGMGGLQLLCLGAIGLYLGNVLLEVKERPSYIVKETFGFSRSPAPRREG